ncbi:hypothetical protein [Glycomyces sp. NPDC048151]|uniref:hypothetical protein n=1 Tax=Glycomyces sp. NPDC048151 TaxID=3364002 RepID=UPI0037137716
MTRTIRTPERLKIKTWKTIDAGIVAGIRQAGGMAFRIEADQFPWALELNQHDVVGFQPGGPAADIHDPVVVLIESMSTQEETDPTNGEVYPVVWLGLKLISS